MNKLHSAQRLPEYDKQTLKTQRECCPSGVGTTNTNPSTAHHFLAACRARGCCVATTAKVPFQRHSLALTSLSVASLLGVTALPPVTRSVATDIATVFFPKPKDINEQIRKNIYKCTLEFA